MLDLLAAAQAERKVELAADDHKWLWLEELADFFG